MSIEDSAVDKPRLGELLVKEGLIPEDSIQKVLDLQAQSPHKLFGRLCVELGLLSTDKLQSFLKKQRKSIKLGELLIKQNRLTPEALEKALEHQQSNPDQRLGEILIEQQVLSEDVLVEALGLQWDLPVLSRRLKVEPLSLLDGLDLRLAHDSALIPLARGEQGVTVAMFNPNDMNALYYLESHFDAKIRRGIASASAIRASLKSSYHQRKAELDAERQAKNAPAPVTERKPDLSKLFEPSAEAEATPLEDKLPELDFKIGFSGDIQPESFDDDRFSSLPALGFYSDEEDEQAETEAEVQTEAAPEPEPDPEPQVITEDSLIVGGVSLTSGQSAYKQQEGMLNYLIKNALLDQASAIHLEPQGPFIRVRYRIDGVLNQKTALPANLGNPMVARLKQICALNPDNTSLPQRNRVQASFNDQELELGIATYPDRHGETMVLNLRPKQSISQMTFFNLDQAGFSPLNLWRIKKLLGQPGGLVIVTGPARAGKTSTVYAALNHLNLLTRSIATAESPVEMNITGISQGSWTPQSGIPFAEMIRSMSYLDTDVMMISELDAPETVEAAVELALGGAKLLTTYPSFDSMGALFRLRTQGLESLLVASGRLALVSQRLVRKLCPHCRQQEAPNRDLLQLLGLPAEAAAKKVWGPRGCEKCQQVGYLGQTLLHEILLINDSMREALINQETAGKIRAIARQESQLVSMAEDGFYKAVEGITSLAEVQRVAEINEYDAQSQRSIEDLLAICRGEKA